MELNWVSRGRVIATIGDRKVEVGGEALLNHDPDYLIYPESVTHWEDGAPIDDAERAGILEQVIAEASLTRLEVRDLSHASKRLESLSMRSPRFTRRPGSVALSFGYPLADQTRLVPAPRRAA